jgi:hypothetical protein
MVRGWRVRLRIGTARPEQARHAAPVPSDRPRRSHRRVRSQGPRSRAGSGRLRRAVNPGATDHDGWASGGIRGGHRHDTRGRFRGQPSTATVSATV